MDATTNICGRINQSLRGIQWVDSVIKKEGEKSRLIISLTGNVIPQLEANRKRAIENLVGAQIEAIAMGKPELLCDQVVADALDNEDLVGWFTALETGLDRAEGTRYKLVVEAFNVIGKRGIDPTSPEFATTANLIKAVLKADHPYKKEGGSSIKTLAGALAALLAVVGGAALLRWFGGQINIPSIPIFNS